MAQLLLACAVLGGGVLVIQLAIGLLGLDADAGDSPDAAAGFHLLTVRGIAAFVAFLGIGGRGALAAGLGLPASLGIGVGAGALAALGVAALTRALRNFDSDGVVRMERALGQPGTVHVKVPGGPERPGKILLTVQDRLLEVPAVSLDGELPTGTPVIVVGLADPGTVEVVRTPDPGAP